MKASGALLLANQLREYQCTDGRLIADCLFSVVCGESVCVERGLDRFVLQ